MGGVKIWVGIVVSVVLARHAVAAPVDAGTDATDTDTAPHSPPAEPAPRLPASPGAPAALPSPMPPPAPPVAPLDWPGDEEAKTDFQQSRPVPDLSPARLSGRYGSVELYGLGEYDVIHDSTQSHGDGASNLTLARPGTVFGDNDQLSSTLCDSRVGVRASTSEARRVRGLFVLELGPELSPTTGDRRSCSDLHVRHGYLALRSPIVDVLVGRTYGLLGWGGKGFLPNTAALIAPAGQLHHLEAQVRVSHIFRWRPIDFEIASALAESAQHDAGTGEGHFALRFAVNRWRGASAQGGGPPTASPLQVGLSFVRRTFEVNDLVSTGPRLNLVGQASALDIFLPVIPARGENLSNALSLTLEATKGSGFADWYPGLSGGVLLPALPNPKNTLPAPVYTVSVDPSLATFDAQGNAHLIDWKTLVLGAQYHLPFARGRRVWVSGLVSWMTSDNALVLTPPAGWGGVWSHGSYYDLNAFVAVTSACQLALSYEVTRQTFGDGVVGRNARTLFSATYFF
jgi:hypothetical protein